MINREILFRGFHPCEDGGTTIYVEGKAAKGRWVEGGYSYCESDKTQFIVLMGKDHISHIGWHREVLLSTTGQYTGLTDKNGVKIFEGDNVREHGLYDEQMQDNIYTIDFKMQMFVAKNADRSFTVSLNTIAFQSELEVIGTIFDKPEEETLCKK